MIRGLPEGLISRAKERARERGEKLDDVLIAILTKYAGGSWQSEKPGDGDKS